MKPAPVKTILLIAALSAGGWYWLHHGKAGQGKGGPTSIPVRVAAAERRDLPIEMQEVGTVAAYETVAVRTRLDSQVMEVHFKDGEAVRQGQLLFVLDDRMLKAQLGEQEANVRRDRAQLENTRLQYERARTLAEKGFQSAAAVDNTKAAYEAQQAIIGASEAALQSTRVQLGYTRVTAPISGRTGTIHVTVGTNVKTGDTQPLVTINQVQPIRVQASLAQGYFNQLRDAMNAGTVAVTARSEDGKETQGTLEYIDNEVDRSSGTFALRAVFANEDERLWPGMFVTLTLRLGEYTQALVVPEVAVQHGQQGNYLFVIKDGKADQRDVKLLGIRDGWAHVEGVEAGDQVAVDGMMSLKEGTDVTVQETSQDAPKDNAAP